MWDGDLGHRGWMYDSAVDRGPGRRGERVGVLGGTFDPPHLGHLVVATEVLRALVLDGVLLVVANIPWQKVGSRELTPAEDRLALVRAAVRDVEGVEASDIEIRRGGESYMVDTLEELRQRDPAGHLYLIVGADVAGALDTWERHEDLPALATLVVVDRPGVEASTPPGEWDVVRVSIPQMDLSSSEVRDRIASGKPVDGLVPDAVVAEIDRLRLYRGAP